MKNAETPVDEVMEMIERAAVPAELHACYKRIEGQGFSTEEREGLRRRIDRKFHLLSR